jgi:hypothetical protein
MHTVVFFVKLFYEIQKTEKIESIVDNMLKFIFVLT